MKNPPAMQETRVQSLNGEDSHGGEHGDPLMYSCLENPMDRGTLLATVHGVAKSRTRLKWFSVHYIITKCHENSSSRYWSIIISSILLCWSETIVCNGKKYVTLGIKIISFSGNEISKFHKRGFFLIDWELSNLIKIYRTFELPII